MCHCAIVCATKHYREGTIESQSNLNRYLASCFLVARGGMNQWCVRTHLRLGAYLLTLRRTKERKQAASRNKNQYSDCSFTLLPFGVGMRCSYGVCV